MEYRTLGDLSVSWLGMGAMRLPEQGRLKKSIDLARAQALIDEAMAEGVTYYDTAYVYHGRKSEPFLGQAFSSYPRESYHLATKYLLVATTDYRKCFERQLANLRTDYLDCYLIHSVMDATYKRYLKNGSIEYFFEQKAKGRIHELGFSAHCSPSVLETFIEAHPWDFVQLQINYRDWAAGNARQLYEIAQRHGLPVVVMEPLRGGKLMDPDSSSAALLAAAHPDWNIADWAFRWLKRLDGVACVLSGMNALSQLEQNVSIFSDDRALTDEEATLLLQTVDQERRRDTVPCTGCRYCVEEDTCPESIDIPYYLEIYNATQRRQPIDETTPPLGGTPEDCIACGACAARCPQSIAIPDVFARMTARG